MSDTAMNDRCPRCGGVFRCGANDATPCACSTLKLDAATLAALRERFSGCLCLACLSALDAGGPIALPSSARVPTGA